MNPSEPRNLGEALSVWVTRTGRSRTALAREAGLTRQTLHNWTSGHVEPSFRTVVRLAEVISAATGEENGTVLAELARFANGSDKGLWLKALDRHPAPEVA